MLGEVEPLGVELGLALRGRQLGAAGGEGGLDGVAGVVDGQADGPALVGLEPAELLLELGQRAALAQDLGLDGGQLARWWRPPGCGPAASPAMRWISSIIGGSLVAGSGGRPISSTVSSRRAALRSAISRPSGGQGPPQAGRFQHLDAAAQAQQLRQRHRLGLDGHHRPPASRPDRADRPAARASAVAAVGTARVSRRCPWGLTRTRMVVVRMERSKSADSSAQVAARSNPSGRSNGSEATTAAARSG